ncbi:MAG: pseudouridine synthase [Alphaproteobacteria bacterium]
MPQTTTKSEQANKGERIAKYLARAGICSRRDAEKMILEGRVKVDGNILASPAFNVTEASAVLVDGKSVAAREPARLWRYHKPAGLVTTARDPQGRPTVFENLPKNLPRVVSVGRLDLTTEGLLLLTNDGALARHLELPKHGWMRHYRVRVHGTVNEARLKKLEGGLVLEGVRYGPIKATLEKAQGASNAWLEVGIREGKNREIRKVMEHMRLTVTRLIRVSFGPFPLAKLAPGAVEEVPPRMMREQLADFFTEP